MNCVWQSLLHPLGKREGQRPNLPAAFQPACAPALQPDPDKMCNKHPFYSSNPFPTAGRAGLIGENDPIHPLAPKTGAQQANSIDVWPHPIPRRQGVHHELSQYPVWWAIHNQYEFLSKSGRVEDLLLLA